MAEPKNAGKRRKVDETSPDNGTLRQSITQMDAMNSYSYDTYGLYQEDSVSQHNPVQVSTMSQDDEKLESLLERLEESRVRDKGFTMQERNMIMEDTQYLAMLSGSETLYKIFQLMCNAQENFKNHEDNLRNTGAARLPNDKRDVKMTFDLEFEKLLIMLKDQYHGMFDKRNLKIMRQNQMGHQDESESETESESDNENEHAARFAYIKKRSPERGKDNFIYLF